MLYTSTLRSQLGFMRPICSDVGLHSLAWQQDAFDEPDNPNDVSRETIEQLNDYLAGRRQQFNLAFDFTSYSASAVHWLEVMSQIPYGTTLTYADFAEMWGNRKAARAAGQACQRNHLPIIFPCHRVISSTGSLRMYSGGDITTPTDPKNIQRKQWLIDLEARNI